MKLGQFVLNFFYVTPQLNDMVDKPKTKVLKSYVYDQLYDGVHGNYALKLEWFAFVRTSVQRDIIAQSKPSDFIPEDEEPHSRSWWNERQVTFK